MAENETPIALPEQTDELEAVLTGAVQAGEAAADQHVEPGETTPLAPTATPVAPAPATDQPGGGTTHPLGGIVNMQ
ncbi:hypothetical protein [Kitasatospora nipponensis]